MEQSSIEWLMEQITYDNGFGQRLNSYKNSVDLSAYFQQAKAMHKEEIENAVKQGWDYNEEGLVQWMGETYYNETFNTEEK